MLKKKKVEDKPIQPIKEVTVKETKEVLSAPELREIVEKLNVVAAELNKINIKIPTTLSNFTTILKAIEGINIEQDTTEFKNLNARLFEIGRILVTFADNQKLYLDALASANESKAEIVTQNISLDSTNAILKEIQNRLDKKAKTYVFDVLKNQNGIYKVIATPQV